MKTSIKKFTMLLLLTVTTINWTNAQCTGCALTITVPNSSTYNLLAGTTVCIIGSGQFTGLLNNFNGNTLCIGAGVMYNPSTAPNYNGNWTINNNGIFQNTSNLNFNSGTNFTNGATGTIALANLTINSGVNFVNNGNLTTTNITVNGGATVTLGGTTVINGSLQNNGSLIVTSSIVANQIINNGDITGGVSSSCNSITSTGGFINNGVLGSSGQSIFVGNTVGSIINPATTVTPLAPAGAPTNLLLTRSGNNINGAFTQVASGGYLILRAIAALAPTTTNPTNFASLVTGQTLGAWTVVAINNGQASTTFSDNIGATCTNIHYRIYSFNASGNCRVYNISNVLSGMYNPIPTISAIAPASRCGNGTLVLGATSSAGIINWYTSATGGTSLSTGNSFTTPSLSATSTYYAEASSNGCLSATRSAVDATINPNLPASVSIAASAITICSGTSVTFTATPTNGGTTPTYQWKVNGTNVSGQTASTFTSTTLANNDLVTVVMTSNATPCLTGSPATSNIITMTVNPTPTVTATSPTSRCGTGTLILSATPSAGTINWYTAATGGTSLSAGNSFTTPTITNTTSYYVDATNSGCTSTVRTEIIAEIKPRPTITSTTPNARCYSGSLTLTATASSGTVIWWANATGGTSLASGNSFTTPSIALSTTYYAGAISVNGCVSEVRTPLLAAINTPTITDTTPASRCGTGTVTLSATPSAGTINWYTSATGGTSLSAGNSFTTPSLSVTTTYYAEASSASCGVSATRSAVDATIYAVSGLVGNDQTLCTGQLPADLNITGLSGNVVKWESADNASFTTNLQTIANTTTTLTSAQMGSITNFKYFRAYIVNSSCNMYTNGVKIEYPSTTWNGTTWSNGTPTSDKKVIFNGNFETNNSYLQSCNCQIIYCCSVQINAGVVVTINSNFTLNVQNEVTVNNSPNPGQLIFENNSSLVQFNNSATNSGNIIYKRNTVPVRRYDYTYWSSPVDSQNLLALSPSTLIDKFYQFSPTIGNWEYVPPATTLMQIGRGYIVRAPQSHDLNTPSIYEASFTGKPNNGTINYSIDNAITSWNLIGNPYPSTLDVNKFLNDGNNNDVIEGTIYLWTHNTLPSNQIPGNWIYNYTSDDYAVYNTTGSIATRKSITTGISENAPTGMIASGQAFFVKAKITGTVQFKNSMREIGNNNDFFRNSSPAISQNDKNRIWLNLVNSEGAFKQTLIGYINGATSQWDSKFDAKTLNANSFVNFYSIDLDNRLLTIQAKGLSFSNQDIIPLGYMSSIIGGFSIEIDKFDGLFNNQDIFLHDKLLHVIHNLKQSKYDFTTDIGTFNDRFELTFSNQILGTADFSDYTSKVTIIKQENNIEINSSIIKINQVYLYDINGKLLLCEKNIAKNTIIINNLSPKNQLQLLKVILEDNTVFSKKIIY